MESQERMRSENARRHSVMTILSILEGLIPSDRVVRQEAEHRLHAAFESAGIEMTSAVQRRQFEELNKTLLNMPGVRLRE